MAVINFRLSCHILVHKEQEHYMFKTYMKYAKDHIFNQISITLGDVWKGSVP